MRVREEDGLDDSDYSSDGDIIGGDREVDDEQIDFKLTASKKISKFV